MPEVRADHDLSEWIDGELSGYPEGSPVLPTYRTIRAEVVGDATNGAWHHRGVQVPLGTLPEPLRGIADVRKQLTQTVGSIEALLASGEHRFQIPWSPTMLATLNRSIAAGGTGIDSTYVFVSVRWEISASVMHDLLERTRQRALSGIAERTPLDQLASNVELALPSTPVSFEVSGSGNQFIVASPGASATLTIEPGDRTRLYDGLRTIGISAEMLAELEPILDDDTDDEPGRVSRVLQWCKRAGASIGINTAGSAAATLLLQYLGLV